MVTDILVEINIGKEESKGGIYIEDTESFLGEISTLSGISVKGSLPHARSIKILQKQYIILKICIRNWLTLGLKK